MIPEQRKWLATTFTTASTTRYHPRFHAKAHSSQQPLIDSDPDGLSVVRHMGLQVPALGPLVKQLEVAARVRSVEFGDQEPALLAPFEAHGGRVGGAHEGLADIVEAVV